MLEWIVRGLRKRRITTRYPRLPEPPPDGFHGRVGLLDDAGAPPQLETLCPTGAIAVDERGQVTLDRARCILCGECVRREPGRFAFEAAYETAARSRAGLVAGVGAEHEQQPDELRRTLGEQVRGLRRSIHVRHIDCGSDGSEEWEIQALWNPYYDIQRLGFFLTNAPRHADVLLVTGPVTEPMRQPLQRTWEVMPEPKALVAVGTDACGGGLHGPGDVATGGGLHGPDGVSGGGGELHAPGALTAGGVDRVLDVDVYVPGSPPAPIAIMHGLLLATGLLGNDQTTAADLIAPRQTTAANPTAPRQTTAANPTGPRQTTATGASPPGPPAIA